VHTQGVIDTGISYLSTFDDQLALGLLLVIKPELDVEQYDGHDSQQRCCDASIKTWMVPWAILASEDEATSNTTDSAESYQSSAAESSLPLPSDVVGLVGHCLGNVAVCSCAGKEDTKVSHTHAFCEAHKG